MYYKLSWSHSLPFLVTEKLIHPKQIFLVIQELGKGEFKSWMSLFETPRSASWTIRFLSQIIIIIDVHEKIQPS